MTTLSSILKRQIELVGLAIANRGEWKVPDLAYEFGCDDLTIKRDMRALRTQRIDIHSEKHRGITLETRPPTDILRELVGQYLGICALATARDRATALLVQRHRERALAFVVQLQRCIDNALITRIDYAKEADEVERDRQIEPLLLFSSDGQWRVLAVNEGKIKQYLLTKILRVVPTTIHFRRIPQEQIDDMFRYSFRSWTGTAKFAVKLRFTVTWAARMKPRQLMETETVTEEPDGSIVLETIVNSLEEMAAWVVSRGEGVIVLEPEKLRLMVIDLARGAIRNYPGRS